MSEPTNIYSKKGRRERLVLLMLVLLFSLGLVWSAAAGLADPAVSWWTIAGGGGTVAANEYTLAGTIGQFDTGRAAGGDYELSGGYWGDSAFDDAAANVFLPAVIK